MIRLSRLPIAQWFAVKEYDTQNRAFLNLYVELDQADPDANAIGCQLLRDHLALYFHSYDGDYSDLKRLLNTDPLKITVIKSGSMERYTALTGEQIPPVGATRETVLEILRLQSSNDAEGGDRACH